MNSAMDRGKEEAINIMQLRSTRIVGGPENQILAIAKRINATNFKTIVASFTADKDDKNKFVEAAERMGIDATSIPIRGFFARFNVFKLVSLLKQNNIKLLCAHDYRADVIGYLAARFVGIPIVAVSHGWTAQTFKVRFYEFIERSILRFMDKVIAVSDAKSQELIKLGVPQHKVVTIHNVIDLDRFKNLSNTEDGKKYFGLSSNTKLVGTIGRLSIEKGQRYFLEAAAKVKEIYRDVKFVIVGDGPEMENLKRLAKRLNVAEEVIFTGWREDVGSLFSSLDIFVLPSLTEGLPTAVLEAFACSKPVVATHVGGVPEVVQHMKTGLLVPPRDSKKLAEAILFALRNPRIADSLGYQGHQLVCEKFSFEKIIGKVEEVYKSVLN